MLGANSRPTAVATYSWGGAARPAGLHTPACRRQMAACRAAGPATAPPAPAHERASAAGGTQEQHGVSSLSAPPRSSAGSSVTGGSSSTVGSHPVPSSWLSHSWHLPSLSLGQTDAMLIRLRRQLGWGGRWAWEHEEEEAAAADDWDEEEEEEEAGEAAGGALGDERPSSSGRSGGDEATAAQLVPSARGSHRRGGGQRQCRGRVLAGATAVRSSTRPWLRGDDPLAAEEMQGWDGAHVLTAAQEAWLSMLVQRAQAAESSMPPAAAPSSRAAPAEQERAHVMRQGEAARQLLFDANLRLVPFARKKLLGGSQLEAGLYEELHAAGREALWRATLAYQPSRRLRFSTLATTCIQNVMRDVLAHPPGQPVRVSRAAQRWARQVRGAAGSLRQQRAAQQRAPEQQEQEPQEPQAGRRRRAKQAAPRPLQRLAAAAQLAPAQVEAGLAAGRRQRVASFDVRVPDAPCGARHHSTLMAALWDVQHQDTDEDVAFAEAQAAREVGQLLLSGVASPLHLAVLLLRFGLPACGPAAGAPGAATAACSLARTGTLSYAVTSGAPGGAGGKLRSSSRAVEFRLEPGETLEGDAEELRSFGAVARRLGISRQYAEKAYRAALGALGQHAAQLAQQGAL